MKKMEKEISRILNTGFLLSIGIASIAKEKAEKIILELVKKGRLNEPQGRKAVKEILKRSKKEKDKIKKMLMR